MGIKLDGSKIKDVAATGAIGTFAIGFVGLLGSILFISAQQDSSRDNIQQQLDNLRTQHVAGRNVHIRDGDVVTVEGESLRHEYNFRTQTLVVTDGDELNTLPFSELAPESLQAVRSDGCAMSRAIQSDKPRLLEMANGYGLIDDAITATGQFHTRYCQNNLG